MGKAIPVYFSADIDHPAIQFIPICWGGSPKINCLVCSVADISWIGVHVSEVAT